jgi:hypothetical protein
MLQSISKILNKNLGEIQLNISTIEEIDFTNLKQDDYLKQQNIVNSINTKIEQNNRFVTTLNNFVTTCSTVISILLALPVPTAPFPVTIGLILTASDKLNYLQKLLNDIKSYLSIYDTIKLNQEKSLADLSNNFGNSVNNFLINSTDSQQIVTNLNKVVAEYKNHSIYIKEDNSGNFKKYYAVAFDKNDKEFLRTDSSHLTNTQILIDTIKLLINKYF